MVEPTSDGSARDIAENIARSLWDTTHGSFAENWNLRALLLRLELGRDWFEPEERDPTRVSDRALGAAVLLGLVDDVKRLTELGFDVAGRLMELRPRPEPWWTRDHELFDSRVASSGQPAAECESTAVAETIAKAMNAEAMREAMTYLVVV